MEISVHIVNAFTNSAFRDMGGNPAGIVLDADHLTAAQKQSIASKVGLSETAFISRSEIAPFRLEFFTPERQIPHCGHATVAAFSLLRAFKKVQLGRSAFEANLESHQVHIQDQSVYLEQSRPDINEISPYRRVYQDALYSLGLNADDLESGQNPFIINTGNSFMLFPLNDVLSLEAIQPDMEEIKRISREFNLVGYYAFTTFDGSNNPAATARMFAPLYGIPEESATGMAAGCLGAYLFNVRDLDQTEFKIEQGDFMEPPSPSSLTVQIGKDRAGRLKSIMVGGHARIEKSMTLEI